MSDKNSNDKGQIVTIRGGGVKALGDGKIGGYLVLFSDADTPDLEGDFFTKDTRFGIKEGESINTPVWFHHRMPLFTKNDDYIIVRKEIGEGTLSIDDKGVLIEAILHEREVYEEMVGAGRLGWSSGTAPHLVDVEGVENSKGYLSWEIKQWILGTDASLTPTPAEPHAHATLKTLKMDKSRGGDAPLDLLSDAIINNRLKDQTEAMKGSRIGQVEENVENIQEDEENMSQETQDALLTAITGLTEAVKGIKEDVDAIKAGTSQEGEVSTNELKSTAGAPAVINSDYMKYDHVPTDMLALAADTLESGKHIKGNKGPSLKMFQALAQRMESDEARKDENLVHAAKGYVKSIRSKGIKANELSQSDLANYGDEWVGVAYSGQLWDKVRNETLVVNKIPMFEFPAGAESFVHPVDGTDLIWYNVAQAADLTSNPGGIPTNTVTASRRGTASKTHTLAKAGARTIWTGELNEDSVLPYVADLNRNLALSGAEYLESMIIDGDTDLSATTNINDIAGTPAATDWFTTVDGFRKLALITNTANARSAGSLTSSDFLDTAQLMGVDGADAADVSKVSFIIGAFVHFLALQLADVKARDVFSSPTIENGNLTSIYGYEILKSFQMHKAADTNRRANTSGLIDLDTPANNTTGSILAVRWDQWKMGWRRRITLETSRIAAADANEIVAMMRFSLNSRSNEAAAISYNVTA